MKFHRQAITKKTTSVLLVALMLFINAVKLFHTHAGTLQHAGLSKTTFASHSTNPNYQQIKQNDRCAICDFQLARDADAARIIIAIAPIRQAALINAIALTESLRSFHATSSGRAPPVLA